MKTFISRAQKLILYIFVAVLVGGSPMAAFADDSAPSDEDGGYVFDEATGRWSSNKWLYDPATNTYIPRPQTPAVAEQQTTPADTNTSPVSDDAGEDTTDSTAQNSTSNNNQINNEVSGKATTGDATVSSNNTAGGATTGDATSIATIMNTINSSSALGGQPYTFTQDIYGDVYGDIELAPELLKAMAQTTTKPSGTVNYTVVDKNTINNDVDLGAESGNAAVLNNTKAGSASSGNATAIANVLNIINSVIAANGSFVGTINIHGNLNGDILLNKQGSPSLIASNADSNPLSNGNLIANATNLTNIINDIDLDATTGTATVDSNTIAGSAKSGAADTNLVVMNLAGRSVTAKNSLLVFVNVLGKWVGIIVDAPTGATAAVLGDDVTSNLIGAAEGDGTIDANSQNQIINNIKVGAHTGDATVSGNTIAGDATTGNASASATVLNMANSAFNVSDWFGVLFINVLGSWYGSFGVDTPQGDEVAASSPPPTSEQPVSAPAQVFSFIAHHITNATQQQSATSESAGTVGDQAQQTGVLAASDHSEILPVAATETAPQTISMPIAIAALAGLTIVAGLVVRLIGMLRERFA